MPMTSKTAKILTDYCENTSLVGLSYISNRRIHFTERLFWLICIIISVGGSYYLIQEYQDSFDSNSISLVMEGTRPQDKTYFPAIGVCEIGGVMSLSITKYVQGFRIHKELGPTDNNYFDVEDFLQRIIFRNTYNTGSIEYFCEEYINCTDCLKCPTSGYKEIADLVHMNCSELITFCSWNGEPIDCCNYFLPLQTPDGTCYMLNSLHTATKNDPHWLNTEFGWDVGQAELVVQLANPVQLNILNSEDIPLNFLKENVFDLLPHGTKSHIQLTTRNIVNDPGVWNVPSEYRKCRFPDEQLQNATYKYYSFKTCMADCLKQLHLKTCGCTLYDYEYLGKSNDKTTSCDYHGLLCLERSNIVVPVLEIMQPWRSNGLNCTCLPSCTDHEINVFENTKEKDGDSKIIQFTITQSISTEQFRRQAVRTRLDIVVAIGGILCLFMGASILSGIEILYFFLIRIFNFRK